MTSILIKDNQALVNCFCAARQTMVSNGPEGNDMRVISEGSEVMALMNSLRV